MIFNQTLKRKNELGSYSVGNIRFFRVCLDFALEPVYPLLSAVLSEPPIYLSRWYDSLRYQGTRVNFLFTHVYMSPFYDSYKMAAFFIGTVTETLIRESDEFRYFVRDLFRSKL